MLFRNVLIILCCIISNSAFAERWFEVEVLVFKQQPAPYLLEDFSLKHDDITGKNTLDLLSPIYNEQAMQACIDGDSRFQNTASEGLFNDNQTIGGCNNSSEPILGFDKLPVTPLAPTLDSMEKPYLLAPEQLQFVAQKRELARKGLTPLLHTGWRFEGQSESKAPNIRLFSGQQLQPINTITSSDYQPSFISLINSTETEIDTTNDEPINWELEGLFKIHLRHYLYITANFDIKQQLESGDLERARFSQFKRVISSEIHYFDHPKMGMIVQIRKFKH
jgi:hypothetical protein